MGNTLKCVEDGVLRSGSSESRTKSCIHMPACLQRTNALLLSLGLFLLGARPVVLVGVQNAAYVGAILWLGALFVGLGVWDATPGKHLEMRRKRRARGTSENRTKSCIHIPACLQRTNALLFSLGLFLFCASLYSARPWCSPSCARSSCSRRRRAEHSVRRSLGALFAGLGVWDGIP
ncbi:hypothetical protein DFH07DRAFT_973611 [Mycena maculata]|uniref:Uncharacterized protein n=1 Tax=Mycena maculata TaxID=230809 RepID=A0AAD7HDM2_9AGAR|nr:hypothetical protein DFH07DRAFT_973611 [Mycena maculata]